MMMMGLAGLCFTPFLQTLSTGFLFLLVVVLIRGAFQAMFTVSRTSLVRSGVPVAQRGRIVSAVGGINRCDTGPETDYQYYSHCFLSYGRFSLSLNMYLNRISRVIGPAFGGFVAHRVGIKSAFYLASLAGFLALILVGLTKEAITSLASKDLNQGPSSKKSSHNICATLWKHRWIYLTAGVSVFMLGWIRKVR